MGGINKNPVRGKKQPIRKARVKRIVTPRGKRARGGKGFFYRGVIPSLLKNREEESMYFQGRTREYKLLWRSKKP